MDEQRIGINCWWALTSSRSLRPSCARKSPTRGRKSSDLALPEALNNGVAFNSRTLQASRACVVLVLLVLLCRCWTPCCAANVLVLHPMHSPSHVLAIRTLILEMVSRGHQVMVVRPNDRSLPSLDADNVTEYSVTTDNSDGAVPLMSAEKEGQFQMPMSLMWQSGTSFAAVPRGAFFAVSSYCKRLLSDSQLRVELSRRRFHVALVDLIFNECGLALAHHLDVPAVGYWAFTFAGGEPQYTTAFNPPSSTPLVLSHFSHRMSFLQRVENHLLWLIAELVMQVTFMTTSYQIQRYLPGTPHPAHLIANMSGMLINTHPLIDYPRLLPPSFLEVGGFHIRNPKPVPSSLDSFIRDSGTDGTILFSMGFTFDMRYIPNEVVMAYFKAFSTIPQNVVMVIKGSVKHFSIPANVKVLPWVRQADVLAHPNTVLFVTHCGMHGVMEALTYGVPMVGIPVFADQQDVLVRLEEKGVAVGLDKFASAGQFRAAIVEVLSNPVYRKQALYLSSLLQHQRSPPLPSAAWLLEHVIASSGAPHLKLASRHLGLWQYLGLDVIAFLVLVVAAVILSVTTTYRRTKRWWKDFKQKEKIKTT